ncbi:MAG: GTP cyclohydrolase II [Pseudomonadota bacterium]
MMDDKYLNFILQVERVASDLRRGNKVILQTNDKKFLISSVEYHDSKNIIHDSNNPAVKLMKIAGLLPQANKEEYSEEDNFFLTVSEEAINSYPEAIANSLEKVSESNVPLKDAENTRIIAFRPRFGHDEHLAIIIGEPEKINAPFVRIHSSCITGDVLGSLKCDCGNQLQKAFEMIKKQQNGIILYLNQEGRGIGIANKLRAYKLQEKGLDTVEANHALGFEADERDFRIAANMLQQIGVKKITLLTNNPDKIKSLAVCGIEVLERKSLLTKTNVFSADYISTKALKLGHILGKIDD